MVSCGPGSMVWALVDQAAGHTQILMDILQLSMCKLLWTEQHHMGSYRPNSRV